jgi:hypothetical protein
MEVPTPMRACRFRELKTAGVPFTGKHITAREKLDLQHTILGGTFGCRQQLSIGFDPARLSFLLLAGINGTILPPQLRSPD